MVYKKVRLVMKANEVPEKLYLHPTAKGNVGASWLTFQLTDEDIEYTRTDAIIEKARKWFIEHTNISQEVDINEDGEPMADSYIKYAKARLDAANEIFENFKNYIIED